MNISDVAAVIGMVTGIAGLIFSLSGHTRSRAEIVQTFLSEVRSEQAISARKYVYNTQHFDVTDETAALLANFYHHWGIMVKHGYLPMWAFEESNAYGTIRLYHKMQPFIEEMRSHQGNQSYAYGFQWLCEKLERRNHRRDRTFF